MGDDRCDLLCLDASRGEAIRGGLVDLEEARRLSAVAGQFGDATRLLVASALGDAGELCVCDLAWIVGRSQNLVAYHLRRLREVGLVTARRDGKMVLYTLTGTGRHLLGALHALSGEVAR